MRIRRFTCGLLALLMMLTAALPAFGKSAEAVVTAKSAKMFAGKSGGRLLGELPKGTEVLVLAVSGKLAKIKYAGKTGYMKKAALKLTEVKTEKPQEVKKTPVPAPRTTPAPAQSAAAVKSATDKGVVRRTTVRAIAYLKPDTTCKKRMVVRKNTAVKVLSETGSFYKVVRSGVTAYMLQTAFEPKAQTTPAPAATPVSGETKTVTKDAKLYKRPSRAATVLSEVDAGAQVSLVKKGDAFSKVIYKGATGFLPSAALKGAYQTPAPEASPEATPAPTPKPTQRPVGGVNASKAETVIAAALAQLGKPYVYGRTGPSSFDCSGLTRYAYSQVGVSLPHSAQSVGYSAGAKVTRSQLQRGDIVCFNTISDSDSSDHVGIYLGGNQFVHASSGQGRVVVNTLTSYYDENFSWGRRVL